MCQLLTREWVLAARHMLHGIPSVGGGDEERRICAYYLSSVDFAIQSNRAVINFNLSMFTLSYTFNFSISTLDVVKM